MIALLSSKFFLDGDVDCSTALSSLDICVCCCCCCCCLYTKYIRNITYRGEIVKNKSMDVRMKSELMSGKATYIYIH